METEFKYDNVGQRGLTDTRDALLIGLFQLCIPACEIIKQLKEQNEPTWKNYSP